MTIKNLFGKKPAFFDSAKSASAEIESSDYALARSLDEDAFLPHIDFSTASNFVKFGSAELYYENAIKRIYQQYPYDGSEKEKQEYHLSSSYLDRWMYDYKYPKTTGYVTLGATQGFTANFGGYGSSSSLASFRCLVPLVHHLFIHVVRSSLFLSMALVCFAGASI